MTDERGCPPGVLRLVSPERCESAVDRPDHPIQFAAFGFIGAEVPS